MAKSRRCVRFYEGEDGLAVPTSVFNALLRRTGAVWPAVQPTR
jgi:hypothetical protein